MSQRDLVYVGHMLDMARKAVAKVQDRPRETYDADENLRLALIHLVQVIGEAARQVSRISRSSSRRWSRSSRPRLELTTNTRSCSGTTAALIESYR